MSLYTADDSCAHLYNLKSFLNELCIIKDTFRVFLRYYEFDEYVYYYVIQSGISFNTFTRAKKTTTTMGIYPRNRIII